MERRETFVSVMDQVRAIAERLLAHERSSHTLQPTALVNEAYMKVCESGEVSFASRAHAIATIVRAMRNILVDYARTHGRAKRGGGRQRIVLEDIDIEHPPTNPEYDAEDFAFLFTSLAHLERDDPQLARVVELRVTSDLTVAEIAECLDVAPRTVHNDWNAAILKLKRFVPADG